jgi:hypothetical protein
MSSFSNVVNYNTEIYGRTMSSFALWRIEVNDVLKQVYARRLTTHDIDGH